MKRTDGASNVGKVDLTWFQRTWNYIRQRLQMVRDRQKHFKSPFLLKVLKKWILLFQYGRDPFRDPCLRNRTVTQQDSRLTASTVMLCWVRNEGTPLLTKKMIVIRLAVNTTKTYWINDMLDAPGKFASTKRNYISKQIIYC